MMKAARIKSEPARNESAVPDADELAALGVRDGADYYDVSVIAPAVDRIQVSVCTEFVGWADEHCTWEIRTGSVVIPNYTIQMRRSVFGVEPLIVNELDELIRFRFLLGGSALVEKDLADRYMPKMVGPRSCIARPSGGFDSASTLGPGARARFARGALRMSVLKRDRLRCRVCGRSADDALDVKLNTHHIRDYAKGGPTVEWNLITLCVTCHDGVQPGDRDLAYALGVRADPHVPGDDFRRRFIEGVQRFRATARERLRQEFSTARRPRR